ncbi:alpha/beta hydrolase [uncultured Microbacterium sp.]|uniref:alpha/beta hydrolase n=1 Tax=uncultured Microbacterium sp. TaxID=191216 RepID=UPI0025E3A256|nr:alpha/beta hydrolase [uncultured Microbacterium sp.]
MTEQTESGVVTSRIETRVIETARIATGVRERPACSPASDDHTIVFVHGNVSSSLFFEHLLEDLPDDIRGVAIDLRGFGDSEHAPIDATRGVRDFSDDLHAALSELGIERPHLFGWSLGGGVVLQYALDHPVASLTLEAPVSPYGFGGTRRDGSRLDTDDAGCGAGGANPDFVERLTAHDTSADAPTSPRTVFRTGYVGASYEGAPGDEDLWVASMLTTSTATGNYPGDSAPTEAWPGFGPGTIGVLNALAPRYFNVSAITELAEKPPILWVHGTADAIVSDASFFDLNQLGALDTVPGWPGAELAPPQPMVSQTRDVLAAYGEAGGEVTELELEGVGHSPHIERPAEVRQALLAHIGYVGRAADPAPPTEAIILRSAD